MNKVTKLFDSVRQRVNALPEETTISEWLWHNVALRGSPLGSRFDIDHTPWLREPLEALLDPGVKEVCVMAAAQMGKSVLACGYTTYALAKEQASVMVILDTQSQSSIFNDTKLFPMLYSCEKLVDLMPDGRDKQKKTRIHFLTNDLLTGPANNSFLRSHSVPVIVGDEVSKWGDGNMANARARTRQFTHSKHLFVSTPLNDHNDFAVAWNAGHRATWALGCLGCGERFIPKFKTLVWDQKRCGRDIDKIKEELTMNCPNCGHAHKQDAESVRRMNSSGGYIATNEGASSQIRSYNFSALVLSERITPWIDIVAQFFEAKDSMVSGYDQPMQEWVNLQLGETWKGAGEYSGSAFVMTTKENKERGDHRVMTVDCQMDLRNFWVIIRDWDKSGDSRLVHLDNIGSFDELDELREKFEIKPNKVIIDAAYQTVGVITEAVNRGWLPIKGTSKPNFVHKVPVPDSKKPISIKRLYSPVVRASHVRLRNNKQAYYVELASDPLREFFVNLRDGKVEGVKWESSIASCSGRAEEYVKQIHALRRKQDRNRSGKTGTKPYRTQWEQVYQHDHCFDLEVYQCSAALMLQVDYASRFETATNIVKRNETRS